MMSKACRKRITAWGMMGLLVVGLNVWCALPARAVPIDYTLTGGQAVGGFTYDENLGNPFTAWNISFQGEAFSNTTDSFSAQLCITDLLCRLTTEIQNVATIQFNVPIFPGTHTPAIGLLYDVNLFVGGIQGFQLFTDVGNIEIQSSVSVPEPPPGVLFLIGLLVLAGARWWTHRQERLQLG